MLVANHLKGSIVKGFVGVLFLIVIAIKYCGLFIDYRNAARSYDIENTDDESQAKEMGDEGFEKVAKKLFSYFETDLTFTSTCSTSLVSTHLCIHSSGIFKEPIRDVLTPPPNRVLA